MSQFDYAVPLAELCLLGDLAIRIGQPVEWDQSKFMAVGNDAANKLVKRAKYRDGWDYSSTKSEWRFFSYSRAYPVSNSVTSLPEFT